MIYYDFMEHVHALHGNILKNTASQYIYIFRNPEYIYKAMW